MKPTGRLIFISILTLILCAASLPAQNLGTGILGSGFSFDPEQTSASSRSLRLTFDVIYREMPGYEVKTETYRFNGDFDQARKSITVPPDADLGDIQEQMAGTMLGIARVMFESQAREILGADWMNRAEAKAGEWERIPVRTVSFSVGRDQMMNGDLAPGDEVSVLNVQCSSPFVDLVNLRIVEGTWVAITKMTFEVPDMSDDMGFASLLGEEVEEEESSPVTDPGVEVMQGAVFVDAEETSFDLPGEWNWLIQKPMKSVVDFYLGSKKRICAVDSESTTYVDDEEAPIYSLYCLTHEGEMESGDDVIAVDINKPERGLLSEVLGRNQGDWTLISVNRWVEEEY